MAFLGGVFTVGLLLIAAGFLWGFLDQRAYFCPIILHDRCLRNLEQIARAKEQFQADHALSNGTPVTADQLVDYVESGWKALRCPGKGTYSINPPGVAPTCSEPDHQPRAR